MRNQILVNDKLRLENYLKELETIYSWYTSKGVSCPAKVLELQNSILQTLSEFAKFDWNLTTAYKQYTDLIYRAEKLSKAVSNIIYTYDRDRKYFERHSLF